MHGTFIPNNRPLLLVDPWGHYVIDPNGSYVGWDGPIVLGDVPLSTLRLRGRSVAALPVADTRGL